MPIGIQAVRSFARHFTGQAKLRIHSDGSLDEADEQRLLQEAGGMPAEIVRPAEREALLAERLAAYPLTRALLERGAYFTKLQLPVCEGPPYFYFDSDIVWLSSATGLRPERGGDAFSTESWSWYYGVANEAEWVRQRIPRRVNSGFYHLETPFPFERMEDMLRRNLFDPAIPYNTDQEIMAYLYKDAGYYHPEDLKRTRVGVIYPLASETCAALHFPGGMWKPHLDQMDALGDGPPKPARKVRFLEGCPLTRAELLRMRWSMKIANAPATNFYRKLRGFLRGRK